MSATRGRGDVPRRCMSSSAASSSRRTSPAYSPSRLAKERRTIRPATSGGPASAAPAAAPWAAVSGSGIAFLIARIIFLHQAEGGAMWDFETDPEYQKKLDWADAFVREEVEPLDLVFPHLQFTPLEGKR